MKIEALSYKNHGVLLDGKWYSCTDRVFNFLSSLGKGSEVEIMESEERDNRTTILKVNLVRKAGSSGTSLSGNNGSTNKDRSIERQNVLRTAVMFMGYLPEHLKHDLDLLGKLVEIFELYVAEGKKFDGLDVPFPAVEEKVE